MSDCQLPDPGLITHATVADGTTEIREAEFAYCISLETVELPPSVTRIGENAFLNCGRLEKIILADGTTSLVIDPTAFIGANPYTRWEIYFPYRDTAHQDELTFDEQREYVKYRIDDIKRAMPLAMYWYNQPCRLGEWIG